VITLSAGLAIGAVTFLGAFTSGIFGMVGGQFILAVLLYYMPVSAAMTLFSALMFMSGLWRGILCRRHIDWPLTWRYVAGSIIGYVLMLFIAFVPSKPVVYLGLGAVHGDAKDAIVYFRNVITPIACFYVAIIAASLYRIDLTRTVPWLAGFAIAYGYCELAFGMDFLSLFHGDQYILRAIARQIQSGAYEKALQETGFVLRGLQDVLLTNLFNLPIPGLPQVFRIGGPTFHSISFAYALSIVSVWLLFNRRWLLPLLALPLLLVIGSKGAMFLLLVGLFVRLAKPLLGIRPALLLTVAASVAWVAGSIGFGIRAGDYHVLGLFAGLREFTHNPLGVGLGLGGNLSSTTVDVNWELAQAHGAAAQPMESAIGVMLYQMGIGSLLFLAFLLAIARAAWRAYRRSGDFAVLFLVVAVVAITANAVLQEEAFFSPLALGFALLLGGARLAAHWSPTSQARSFRE